MFSIREGDKEMLLREQSLNTRDIFVFVYYRSNYFAVNQVLLLCNIALVAWRNNPEKSVMKICTKVLFPAELCWSQSQAECADVNNETTGHSRCTSSLRGGGRLLMSQKPAVTCPAPVS